MDTMVGNSWSRHCTTNDVGMGSNEHQIEIQLQDIYAFQNICYYLNKAHAMFKWHKSEIESL